MALSYALSRSPVSNLAIQYSHTPLPVGHSMGELLTDTRLLTAAHCSDRLMESHGGERAESVM